MKNHLKCANCGKPFESKYNPFCCSDACKKQYRNRRNRQHRSIDRKYRYIDNAVKRFRTISLAA